VCLDEIEPGMAMALRTLIARLDNLGKSVYEDLLTMISRKFPDLYAKPKIPVWQQEHVIYVTREGKARKEAEISELVNVKMKENARAIGEAAARGDLSENSEYKFALEERDLLRARLGQMQDELSKVRVIEPDDIPTDEVGIGSKVTFKDQASARTVALTFLGPWDSALERGIVNYRSPVGQSIMGRHIGDHVELDIGDIKGAFVVDHIESALAPEPQV
jgi:transcription elongation GreA/GreB family factor